MLPETFSGKLIDMQYGGVPRNGYQAQGYMVFQGQ